LHCSEALKDEILKKEGEIEQYQKDIKIHQDQLKAIEERDKADKDLIHVAASSKGLNVEHECVFPNKCHWNQIIEVGEAFNTQIFVANNPANFIQLELNFAANTEHTDSRCGIDVLLGVNQICKDSKMPETTNPDIANKEEQNTPNGHEICSVQFVAENETEPGSNCDNCNKVSIDIQELAKANNINDRVSQFCVIVKAKYAEIENAKCSIKTDIAFLEASQQRANVISCPENPEKSNAGPTSKSTDLNQNDLLLQASNALKIYTGFWPIIATVGCVMFGFLGIFIVLM